MDVTPAIVNQLKQRRQATGLSQRALAALAGVRQSHLSEWETGKITPTTQNLARWAAALGALDNNPIIIEVPCTQPNSPQTSSTP